MFGLSTEKLQFDKRQKEEPEEDRIKKVLSLL